MTRKKKPRDYRSIWLISLVVLLAGVLLTVRPAMIRPLGYILLALGGAGLVWGLSGMDGSSGSAGRKDGEDREVTDEDWTDLR